MSEHLELAFKTLGSLALALEVVKMSRACKRKKSHTLTFTTP